MPLSISIDKLKTMGRGTKTGYYAHHSRMTVWGARSLRFGQSHSGRIRNAGVEAIYRSAFGED